MTEDRIESCIAPSRHHASHPVNYPVTPGGRIETVSPRTTTLVRQLGQGAPMSGAGAGPVVEQADARRQDGTAPRWSQIGHHRFTTHRLLFNNKHSAPQGSAVCFLSPALLETGPFTVQTT